MKKILLSVAEKVEKQISSEMKNTKGSIMHDGWTFGGCHYIGLFALYVSKAQRVGSITAPLLSMSPMNSVWKCDKFKECDCTSEATDFDADTHAKHIKDVFALILSILMNVVSVKRLITVT